MSWIFDGLLGEKGSRILAMILFAVCTLGFLATAFSFMGIGLPHENWRTLATIFAVLSVLSLIAFWNELKVGNSETGLGSKDNLMGDLGAVRELTSNVPGIEIVEIEASHLMGMEEPDKCNQLILGFFETP